ncbi:MAG: ABC transporter substrate-binding protein [Gammaproteobacteria bacterium]|nr:ABC transporter substrate-binding protein [Pseudomonadales bacterium]MCP5349332.1 ABC transporter substrate-binding protein [Pseudomonadales bacterium]
MGNILNKASAVGLILCALLSSNAIAQSSPSKRVEGVVEQVLTILRNESLAAEARRDQLKTELGKVFDSRAMAQSALSTNWRSASSEQQDEFQELFRQTLENTYIGRIEAYTNETVEYRAEDIDNNRATVETTIVTAANEIPVNYKLRLRSDGWYVYDVEVENVSMISSYRETYRSVVRRSGMDNLLSEMRKNVEELGAASGS